MTDLERYRDEIDEIDSEIVRLFEKRMKVSEEVAEYKIKTGKQVLDPARESQKIHTLKEKAHGDFNSLGVQELFRQIMAISRKRQYQLLTEHGIYGERNFTTVKHVPLEMQPLYSRESREPTAMQPCASTLGKTSKAIT